jgi:hypothetical protein
LIELLPSPHVPASDEDDKEREVERRPDIKALRKYLHENTGLSWDVIEDACELCEQAISERGEVTDELPTAGPGGARNLANSRTREGGEKVFKSPGRFEKRASLGTLSSEKRSSPLAESEYRASPASDSASFFAMFPDAERIGTTYGSSQFDPAPPLTAKARKIARDSVPGSEADRHFREMFPDAPEVGEWLPRRW